MRVNEAEAYASKAGAEVDGRNLSRIVFGAETRTATGGETKPEAAQGLLEAALERRIPGSRSRATVFVPDATPIRR